MNKHNFNAIGFNNKFRLFVLQIYLYLSSSNVYFFDTFLLRSFINDFFIKKKKVLFKHKSLGDVEGLFYEANKKALQFTEWYFSKYLIDSNFIKQANKSLKTTKYACFIEKKLACDFFEIWSNLTLVKEFAPDKEIIIIDTHANRFIIDEFSKAKGVNFQIYWLKTKLFLLLEFIFYYMVIFRKILIKGVTYKVKTKLKLYKEAAWGLTRPNLRDDFIIDNYHFDKEAIIFYSRHYEESRNRAAEGLRNAGYKVIALNKCKLNIKGNLLLFVRIFLIQPFLLFFNLILENKIDQADSVLKFYLDCLDHFLLLTNYDIKCHISNTDHGEIAETIIMNRLGCKNLLYHWSDMTSFKNVSHAFTIHNVHYIWGAIHHNFQKDYFFNDKVKIVGCIFFRALDNFSGKNSIPVKKKTKKVFACDDSFGNNSVNTEKFYLDFLELITKLIDEIPDAELILKTKNNRIDILNSFSSNENKDSYFRLINYLNSNKRFTYCDYNFAVEELILSSDVVVNMGMSSPATIALLFHKEAVYYDRTNNDQHPMTKFKNTVTFEDKDLLIKQVKGILDNKKSVLDCFKPDFLSQFDYYRDTKALERLINEVYEEVNN